MADVRPDSAETQSLLHQAQAGDRQAFEQLFASHRAYLRQMVELRLDPRQLARRLRQAVAQLPEGDREVVLMRHFEGLSNQEVGCLLGMEPGTVSKRHGRAMLRLHKILFEGGMTESQL